MAEVYINSNFPVKTKIYYAGEIMDADGSVVAEIFDITEDPSISPLINPLTRIAQLTASKLEEDAGTYKIVFPFELTNRSRRFKIKWTYAIQTELVNHISYVDVVAPYVEFSELVEDLGFGTDQSDPNTKTYHELIMAEKWARGVIENYTGQVFSLYSATEIVYGDRSDSIRLKNRIHQLNQLYQNDVLLVDKVANINNWSYDTEISEGNFGIRISRANLLDNTVYSANGMVPPSINDGGYGVFQNGSEYKVNGIFGWSVVPNEVSEACVALIKDYFSKDRAWREKYIGSIQSFDWNFKYNQEAFVGTGNLYVDQILKNYVLIQMAVI
jgi:hypothetical protein